MNNRTPLYEQHTLAGGKLVDFHGWDMPLHYGSQLDEHHHVRKDAGMFDVSHMTVVDLLGAGGRQFLRHLLANDIDRLDHTGRALYSCMLNQHGGIIDDLIVYYRGSDNYRLVLNSATRENDLQWIRDNISGFAVGIQERHELSMLAVQGPQAIQKLMQVIDPAQADAISTLQAFECVDVQECFFARTGYTGEDGFEIILPKEHIVELWQALIEAGVQPCGLGARDTLRLEAGMMLYGQDLTENTTPLESGLAWTIAWSPEERNFIGRGSLLVQKQQGIKHKMVGLILEGKGIMRTGQKVIVEGLGEGEVTSGSFSPTLKKSIAFARVPKNTPDECLVEIRNKRIAAKVTKPRFVKHGEAI